MKKYQTKFLEKIRQTLSDWESQQTISFDELYRFLHSIAGTGASIGLHQYSAEARERLDGLDPDKDYWIYEDIYTYLVETVLIEKMPENQDVSLILVISEHAEYLAFIKDHLEPFGYMVIGAITLEKGNQLFIDQKPDCVLLDYPYEYEDAPAELDALSQKAFAEIVPVIILSELSSKDVQNQAYKRGLTDYFVKPVDFEELAIRISNRIQLRSIFEHSIMFDELTGVFTRRYLRLEGTRQLELYHRYQTIFSLVLMDLDFFKKINDTYGHQTGDEVLRGFADFLTGLKREGDLVIRLGGEEFVLLLPNTNSEQAMIMIERFRQMFRDVQFTYNQKPFSVTFSAGISEVTKPINKIEELSDEADKALYAAKRTGRNKTLIFDPNALYEAEQIVTICIIDDDEILRHLVEEQLHKVHVSGFSFQILTFADGEEFLETNWYQPRQKFLVVLDRMMPGLDGLEVLSQIRSNYPELDIMVVMLTGQSDEREIVQALNAGADDYITKPFQPDELRARIQRLLQRTLL
ncbi:GGDEF domain-containing response regulator [Alkalicoccobacillus murimartini]|uniref:Diguanylate cyclase (GGDEF)-like protein n=1 Tax=Alkalicoccobacillus murimartini TaxID=171685 RepID=A0ABT9YD17_9BACI|nr:diguanylate cyclase [Alkalicoccobacillus murimartini]MDQ0205744.1 diguanylate cyclase (GGDEF)-like protein [Alkalicoccobacillus murimartini]